MGAFFSFLPQGFVYFLAVMDDDVCIVFAISDITSQSSTNFYLFAIKYVIIFLKTSFRKLIAMLTINLRIRRMQYVAFCETCPTGN